MRELTNDPFFRTLGKYPRCVIDYRIIKTDAPHFGLSSHRLVLLYAMIKIIGQQLEEQDGSEAALGRECGFFEWDLDISKAKAVPKDPAELLRIPKIVSTDYYGNRRYDCPWPNGDAGDQIPYWYAFIETPHTTGYGPGDLAAVNAALFPMGTDALEAYEWSTDWSNYFDDGREWWGTACWSIYDKSTDRYVVIMASATD
ncbi:MAG: hypothetical protein IIZ56_05625 [Clostridia bacterium]|nr:hypothetical protein [Clostridia bacterium]